MLYTVFLTCPYSPRRFLCVSCDRTYFILSIIETTLSFPFPPSPFPLPHPDQDVNYSKLHTGNKTKHKNIPITSKFLAVLFLQGFCSVPARFISPLFPVLVGFLGLLAYPPPNFKAALNPMYGFFF